MTNSWVLIFFNLLFTSVPPLVYGILDQDMSADALMCLPELYGAAHTSKVAAHAVMIPCVHHRIIILSLTAVTSVLDTNQATFVCRSMLHTSSG